MAAHRYWRLAIHSTWSNDNWTSVATLTGWTAGLDGDQLLASKGATCSASTSFTGFPATNANDGNDATAWITNTSGGVFTDPTYLNVDLGAGVAKDIRQIAFTSRTDSFWLQCPKSFDWQFSDDNVTYTTAFSAVTPQPTAAGQYYFSPSAGASGVERLTTLDALIAANFPTAAARLTQAAALVPYTSYSGANRVSEASAQIAVQGDTLPRVTNAAVLVAVAGRIANPKLRAWTFTLDGHDFYVLRLGTMGTLVYDVYSGQWMDWDAFSQIYWPVNVGFNWVDGLGVTDSNGNVFGSNVLVGDDTYPLLYMLEPLQPYDQSPDPLDPTQQYFFPRILQGQFPMKGREVMPCYACWLTTDMGAPAYVGASVTLEISDDAGQTYVNMGSIPVTPGNNTPEIAWYSLGQIQAPGRLFRITDDGAVARVDSLEMNDPDEK